MATRQQKKAERENLRRRSPSEARLVQLRSVNPAGQMVEASSSKGNATCDTSRTKDMTCSYLIVRSNPNLVSCPTHLNGIILKSESSPTPTPPSKRAIPSLYPSTPHQQSQQTESSKPPSSPTTLDHHSSPPRTSRPSPEQRGLWR